MGMTLKRMGRYGEAEQYYQEAGGVYDEVDDGLGRAMLNSGLADLRYRVGDTERALDLAEESLKQRAAVNDKTHELQALLVITRMTDDPVHFYRARELARELKLKREATLIEFNALSRRLQHEVDDKAAAPFTPALAELDRMPDEIEMPTLCVLAGKLMIGVGQLDTAESYLQRAERLAGLFGLAPEEIECHTQLGRLHLAGGDFEQAYACFRSALDTAKKVAGNIDNAEDRRSFQSRPTITYLVSEIRKLAGALAKKKAGALNTCLQS